ncbi:hypothetical protein MLD38_012788 [Melastoma candidum]|uniref:Uncharacterized protein n=1 Tax=Melastoma candidum TaxID=119954 RepID=A0ACB9RAK0_9MYRT|nr:hypothetical protein MLD38_012788 [Melastoma candidum]
MGEVELEPRIVSSSGNLGTGSGGLLYAELRIPKVDDKGDPGGGDVETVIVEDRMVECGLCGKTFQSKKALSGHTRVHAQNHGESTKKLRRESAAKLFMVSSTLLEEGKPPTCAICGRNFMSMNALYGHMRSHPDRSWRGVQPPVSKAKPKTVTDFDQFTIVSAGWSVTGKRGRNYISSVNSGSPLCSEDKDLSNTEKGLEIKDGVCCFGGEVDETKKCATVGVLSHSIPEKDLDNRDIKTEEASYDSPRIVADNQRLNNRAIKRKVRELDEIIRDHSTKVTAGDAIACISDNEYTCKTCKKSFTSPQSLGGHRSRCNKSKEHLVRAKPSLQPQPDSFKATSVGQVVPTYRFPGPFSTLCNGKAVADFDLNQPPTTEESEEEDEPKPNAKDPCMSKPALVMGISI